MTRLAEEDRDSESETERETDWHIVREAYRTTGAQTDSDRRD